MSRVVRFTYLIDFGDNKPMFGFMDSLRYAATPNFAVGIYDTEVEGPVTQEFVRNLEYQLTQSNNRDSDNKLIKSFIITGWQEFEG